jgi:hypothetical protein
MSANERTKRRIWVRCGGRCVICNMYFLCEHLDDGHAIRPGNKAQGAADASVERVRLARAS